MAYASASDVAALTPHLLGKVDAFSESTCPTQKEVQSWLSSGCSLINAVLASRGYGAIGTTSAAYDFARDANATYAAWRAERSRMSARISRDENSRADFFREEWEMFLKELRMLDLSRMGVSQTSTAYAGGISQSDKDTVADDSDRVPSRFRRGMFDNPDSLRPGSSAS